MELTITKGRKDGFCGRQGLAVAYWFKGLKLTRGLGGITKWAVDMGLEFCEEQGLLHLKHSHLMQWRLAIAWMRVAEAEWRWERRSQDSPKRPFVYPFAGDPSTWHVDGIWWAWILWSEKISFKEAGRELWWGEWTSLSWCVQVKD